MITVNLPTTPRQILDNALYTSVILESIDFEDYDVGEKANTLNVLSNIFISEMRPCRGNPVRIMMACDNWLRGLASACTVPYMNYDACVWAKEVGLLSHNATEAELEEYPDKYWAGLAYALFIIVSTSKGWV